MIRWFKHVFIPHHGNDHKPHLLRESAVSALLLTAIALFFVSFAGQNLLNRFEFIATIYPSLLVDLANESRVESGLPALAKSDELTRAAQLKAEHMAEHDYFAHISPDGTTPWYWMREAGYEFAYAGENLAIDFEQSNAVDDAWMESPAHRANILKENFAEIGIAAYRGEFEGRQTTIVVQMFGTPAAHQREDQGTELAVASEQTQEDETDSDESTDSAGNDAGVDSGARSEPELSGDGPGQSGQSSGSSEPSEPREPIAVAETREAVGGTTSDQLTQQSGDEPEKTASSTPPAALEEESEIEVIYHDRQFVAAYNKQATTTFSALSTPRGLDSGPHYVSAFERLLVEPSRVVQYIYAMMAAIVVAVLGAMVVVEVQKQHMVNVTYGCLLLALLVGLMYLNETLPVTGFL